MTSYCPICLTDVEQVITLNCNHKICNECIIALIYYATFKKCPVCRTDIDLSNITPIEIPDSNEDQNTLLLSNSPYINVILQQNNTESDESNNTNYSIDLESNQMIQETFISTVRINQSNQYGELRQHIISIDPIQPTTQHNQRTSERTSERNIRNNRRNNRRNNQQHHIVINVNELLNFFMTMIICGLMFFIFFIFFIKN